MFDAELESFKTSIDLRAYAASLGYAIDRRESCRASAVMRHPDGDKIIISRKPDNHYTYWSVRREHDAGTIIDFVKHRKGLNLGGIRKELRAWTGTPAPEYRPLPELPKTHKDRAGVQDRYASMQVAHRHPYLEEDRKIPALALGCWRFVGRIKIDHRSNAVFPHYDAEGLCGYELKNRNFTSFAAGGSKGLWLSKTIPEDRRLVICESAIDALSYAVLFPDGHARYASLGGKPNPAQPGLLRAAITRIAGGSEIVAAMDGDGPGRQLAELVRKVFESCNRPDLAFKTEEPSGFKDWNDELRASITPFLVRAATLEPRPA